MAWRTCIAMVAALLFTGLAPPDAKQADAERRVKAAQERLEGRIAELATSVEGEAGFLRFDYGGVTMLCISDVNADRMRLIAPIAKVDELVAAHYRAMLEANFHTALDARYATSQGVLYSAFIHPLEALNRRQIDSALRQVASLAQTFGTTYSSGELSFGGAQGS